MAMKINLRGVVYDVKCPVCGSTPVEPMNQVYIVDDPENPSPDKIATGSVGRCTAAGCRFVFVLWNHPEPQGPPNPSLN